MSRRFDLVDGFPVWKHDDLAYGVRGGRAPDERPTVACIGCSHTYGIGVDADSAWPSHLQRHLGDDWQVLNLGRGNYGLKLAIDWFRHHTSALDVRSCVIQVPLFCRQPLPSSQPDEPQFYTARFGPMGCLLRNEISASEFVKDSPTMFRRDLERLRNFCRSLQLESIVPLVVLYRTPDIRRAFPEFGDLVEIYVDQVQRMCDQEAIACISRDDLSNVHFARYDMLADGTHPNARGHAYIARLVRDQLDSMLEFT